MMFAALFFSAAVVRSRLPEWPPSGSPDIPRLLPTCNTLVLAASSVWLQRALNRARAGKGWRAGLNASLALGVAFLGLQSLFFARLIGAGLRWEEGVLAGVIFGLAGFHAAHALVGLVGLAAVAAAPPTAPGLLRFRLWTMYWHFVGVVWLSIYAVVFTW
jgi:cytochrome c oxidase subunit III